MGIQQFACSLAEIRHFFKAVGTFLPKPLINLLRSKRFFTVRFKEDDYALLTQRTNVFFNFSHKAKIREANWLTASNYGKSRSTKKPILPCW
uniref:Uncharacterized protein n=1 Tax=uncultured Sphingobacterium sp. EB080_L08E11 TaxID=710992 RepID=E0Y0W1_9SPHI|nr:hypothetical protein [uncultured Sphingobacterium sp. EB080_L08E11]